MCGISKAVVRDGEDIQQLLARLPILHIPFSGDECFGKCVDLHRFYNIYINSKFGRVLKYTDYVAKFPGVDDENVIPVMFKGTGEYRAYMKEVFEYLVFFLERARPLAFLDRVFREIERGFEGDRRGKKRSGLEIDSAVEDANTIDDMMELGLDTLKEGLDTLGLKSGGTLRERAARLLQAKNGPGYKLYQRHSKKNDETALVEAKVKKMCEILSDTLEDTRRYVINKQAMTASERIADAKEQESDYFNGESDDEDDNDELKNPLKVPLGWDGRPIPYWLYKLHGLKQEFKCEICGNSTYFGRRSFEKHFKEDRHQHGMRCLGIPNNKSFNEITSIEDAKNLWEEIQVRQESIQWRPEIDEEFEDTDGNVYDSKTFTYLSRQGLV